MTKRIIIYPNPILLAKSQPVEEIDQTIRDELDEMVRIMVSHKGIGLAAPQINSQLYQVVNPMVAWQNGEQSDVEGCLSIPNEYYEINRAKEIVLLQPVLLCGPADVSV